jgi:hypothetical protein
LVEPVPEHRALLGLDVVRSAENPGYHLSSIPAVVDEVLDVALAGAGIGRSDVFRREPTGDGVLLTLPSALLGTLLDLAAGLEGTLAERNRWRKPEVRLRIAVEVGPVGSEPGFYAAKISLGRLLGASAFKRLFLDCLAEQGADAASTALIVSDTALRTAFGGDHTSVVRRAEFSPLSVRDKEYADTAWVRIPGFDTRTATAAEPAVAQPEQGRLVNTVHGTMSGIQAGIVTGPVTFGQPPR